MCQLLFSLERVVWGAAHQSTDAEGTGSWKTRQARGGPAFLCKYVELGGCPRSIFFKLSRLYRQGTDVVFVQKTKPINVFDTYFVVVI